MTPKEMARLIEVLDASFQAEQARMGEVGRRIDTLKDRLRALDPTWTGAQGDGLDPAVWTGADMRWRAWAQTRRKTLNRDLARLFQERESRRADLSLAFGKFRAAESMRDKLLLDEVRHARRNG